MNMNIILYVELLLISHVGTLAAAGRTESPTWPLSNTLCIMRLMDDARAQLALSYDSVSLYLSYPTMRVCNV